MKRKRPRFLEFFAGGGLSRLGLEQHFDCAFANDIDAMKCETYCANFGGGDLVEGDIWDLDPTAIPTADLAWASFPCQDLSLAGARGGLSARRSGAFWGFWRIIEQMAVDNRAPSTLVLENVTGLLSSNGGQDFQALIAQLAAGGYKCGAMVADAVHFTPQSRPRLFIIASQTTPSPDLMSTTPHPIHHPMALQRLVEALPPDIRKAWLWWRLPTPPIRNTALIDILDHDTPDHLWKSAEDLDRLLNQMTPAHRARFEAAEASSQFQAGAVYRRIRTEDGAKVQRAEIRYDGLAGCLRTPAGGSSKQFLIISENGESRLRTLTAREAARLMGCPDRYILPSSETAGLKVMGDGVCAPVVGWLADHLLSRLCGASTRLKVDALA